MINDDDDDFEEILDSATDFDQAPGPSNVSVNLRTDAEYAGFDNNMGNNWYYPTNFPVRDYQYNIVKDALFRNTLVVLPTGLGKTFIAAVIMYNYYRWYPTKKIVFMAPTKPLVAQQIDACHKIMGIPKIDVIDLTGRHKKEQRKSFWKEKRIFFVTPQVVVSDMTDPSNEIAHNIKLLIVDEAHKAVGKYAYTQVVQYLQQVNRHFRILALSATPGKSVDSVAEIVQNLLISHIEVRSETSIDVVKYIHKKNIRTIVVPLDKNLQNARAEWLTLIEPYVSILSENGVISGSLTTLSKGWLITDFQRYKTRPPQMRSNNHSEIMNCFSTCVSLYYALELLDSHGFQAFLNFFEESGRAAEGERYFVSRNPKIQKYLNIVRKNVPTNILSMDESAVIEMLTNEQTESNPFGHPKFTILRKQLLEHFKNNDDSKVIIFSESRITVFLIYRMLLINRPKIRAKMFVGQGSGTKCSFIPYLPQKEQLLIMRDFRSGIYNTLIATSVAEEGIDIGEIDLIVCFDITSTNPTRFVQRIGRTGRKRKGEVIMLATVGKEVNTVKEVLSKKDKTNSKLINNRELERIFYISPRLVPPEFKPECLKASLYNYENGESSVITDSITDVKKSPDKKTKQSIMDYFDKAKMVPDSIENSINESLVCESVSKINGGLEPTSIVQAMDDDKSINLIDDKPVNIRLKAAQLLSSYKPSNTKLDVKDILYDLNLANDMKVYLLRSRMHEIIALKETGTRRLNLKIEEIFGTAKLKEPQKTENVSCSIINHISKMNGLVRKEIESVRITQLTSEIQFDHNDNCISDSSEFKDKHLSDESINLVNTNLNRIIDSPIQFAVSANLKSSTPLQSIRKLKFSKPSTSNQQSVNIFERSMLSMSSDKEKRYQAILNFFGLNSIDDCFEDGKPQETIVRDTSHKNIDFSDLDAIFGSDNEEVIPATEPNNFIIPTSPKKAIPDPRSMDLFDSLDSFFDFSINPGPNNQENNTKISLNEERVESPELISDSQDIFDNFLTCKTKNTEGSRRISSFIGKDKENINVGIPSSNKNVVLKTSLISIDDFSTCRQNIQTSSEEETLKPVKKTRNKKCSFFDNEAKDSDDSQGDDTDNSQLDVSNLIASEDEDDGKVDMKAKYLQSVKNIPVNPHQYRMVDPSKYANMSNIFSQAPERDVTNYAEDSFVVSNEEEEDDISKLSLLDRAEMILEARRKRRKQSNDNGIKTKRRKVVPFADSSTDDEI